MSAAFSSSYPTAEPFKVRVDHRHPFPGRILVLVAGEIDITAAPQVVSMARVAAACSRDMMLDLQAVSFTDGAGVGSLVDAQRALERCGQYLLLRHVPPGVSRVM